MNEERTITDGAAARALAQHYRFLGHFLTPQSPFEVASRVGMAANLVHHHVRKLEGLSLLKEVRRENGRVYYVLTARQFRVPLELLPPGDPDENAVRMLRELQADFLDANARSWSYVSRDGGGVYGFESAAEQAGTPPPSGGSEEPHPAHLDTLTLRLTPERYRHLALALSALLSEAAQEGVSASGEVCTLAVLGCRSSREVGPDSIGRGTSTSLPFPSAQPV